MSRRQHRPATTGKACSIVVCHGCCCAGIDGRRSPEALRRLDRLQTMLRHTGVAVTVTPCLGPCEHSDVIVVRPSEPSRRQGARPTWLGRINDEQGIDELVGWVSSGGPGVAPLPLGISLQQFRPHRAAHTTIR